MVWPDPEWESVWMVGGLVLALNIVLDFIGLFSDIQINRLWNIIQANSIYFSLTISDNFLKQFGTNDIISFSSTCIVETIFVDIFLKFTDW